MRDILTIIASIVILILAVAVAAPPFIRWEDHRTGIDEMIARASGTEARTEGEVAVRLLPTPRIELGRLRLGGKTPDSPVLTADAVWAEIALTPLLRGEVRFTETRVGRADIRIPVAGDGEWRLPPDLVSGSGRAREWAIENLSVAQLLVTTQSASTGRTNQAFAENVVIQGQKLIGPWRVEGTTAGVPFRLVTGELAEDKTIQVKLSGGGDIYPRFDLDARLGLNEGTGEATTPSVTGKAKVLFGPPAQLAAAGIPIPIAVETEFRTVPGAVELGPVSVEAGEGGASLRMTGDGRIGLNEPRISLRLEGRRLDADSFILSSNGQDFKSRLQSWSLPLVRVPIDLDLKIDSIGLGQEDLSNAILKLSLDTGRAQLDRIEFTAPGETRVAVEGQLGLTTRGGINGKVALASNASDRLARYLARIGLNSPLLRMLDGRPVEASSEIAFSNPVLSFNRLRLKTGESTLTGNVRYTAPEANERGRLEAQVAIQNLNLDDLPQVSSVFQATQNIDIGLILDARAVSAGRSPPTGRISARILSDGPALLVETLDIVDLAGANARVRGRIAPDGSGRISGKVTAQRADPLVDLLGSVWVGGISKLVPHFVREGALDLDVASERVAPAPGSNELRLRTIATGRIAGGPFEGRVESIDGRTESLILSLSTDSTGRWVNRPAMASLNRPSKVDLRGTRVGSGLFNVTLTGDIAGVRVATTRPFSLSEGDDVVDSGEAEITTPDITPFLQLLGDGAGVAPPVPVTGRVTLGRERGSTLLEVNGKVANDPVQARLVVASRSDISGEVSLGRLSLPWLVATLTLNVPGDPNATAIWSTARFGQSGRLVSGGQVTFRAGTLDLGRGLQASRASFVVGAQPDGISIRNFDATIGSGRITGATTITREGALATIVGEGSLEKVPLWALTGSSPFEAVLSGPLRFGAAGGSLSELVANLGGAGEWQVTNLRIPAADPNVFERVLKRALAENDPLAEGRAEAIVGMELGRAPLSAASVRTSAALVGGILRLSPFVVEGGQAVWQGGVTYDLKTLQLDARGALTAKASPPEWVGAPPSIGLNWQGSLTAPVRQIDAGPFRNGLAAIVLKRELEKIEAFERAAAERQRQIDAQREAERQRARAAEEEALRQARARAEAERARREAERLQSQQQSQPQDESGTTPATSLPPLNPPVEVAPPPSVYGAPIR
ncbi:AsmA family protein [Microvirga arsenatis]|uniref:AsmA family protein n=1 Tax=Microvirga arsenatis TaxID=2692265 RepID=A0ABW9Z057_9HYPH|nr:AsmA family protein [Microvirga arsenatis]NBJ11937.1 AsmA family protein [Microvirga arsenatis]NBJ24049.1 AsmA family protein [Microvirga arsenatis]